MTKRCDSNRCKCRECEREKAGDRVMQRHPGYVFVLDYDVADDKEYVRGTFLQPKKDKGDK